MTRSDKLTPERLRRHIDAGRAVQNGRGYKEFKHYLEHGDEFGQPLTVKRLMIAFNRTRPTIMNWLRVYCEQRGTTFTIDLHELLIKK